MKNFLVRLWIIILVNFIPVHSIYCQWKWVNPTPQGHTLHDLQFVNDSTGFAAGDGGTIIKTIDGGANWNRLESGTYKSLSALSFISESVGYVVSSEKLTLKTTNGGVTWTNIGNAPVTGYSDICFPDEQTGYVIGDHQLYKSANGGLNWASIGPYGSFSVWFTDATHGCMATADAIYQTNDGGAIWANTQQNIHGNFGGFSFPNPITGSEIPPVTNICGYFCFFTLS